MDYIVHDGTAAYEAKLEKDKIKREIPVVGVEVRARVGVRILKGHTDNNGYYTCHGPRFRSKAHYSIRYQTSHFKINDAWLSDAKRDGPRQKGDWNKVLQGHEEKYYATIFRAAYHYYYQYILGLRRPPQHSFWSKKLLIKATYLSDDGRDNNHLPIRRFVGSDIKIHSKWRNNVLLYSTTIHEIAHSSHWKLNKAAYSVSSLLAPKVNESWSRGVEWALTRMVYLDYEGRVYRPASPDYTLVVADMIDNASNENTNHGIIMARGDSVENYTIRQIEDVLENALTWNDWRRAIHDRHNNSTKSHLNELFEAY